MTHDAVTGAQILIYFFCLALPAQVNAKEPSKLCPRPSSAGSHDGGPFSGSDARGGSSQGNKMAGSQGSAVLCDAGNTVRGATSATVLPSKAARTTGACHTCCCRYSQSRGSARVTPQPRRDVRLGL